MSQYVQSGKASLGALVAPRDAQLRSIHWCDRVDCLYGICDAACQLVLFTISRVTELHPFIVVWLEDELECSGTDSPDQIPYQTL